MLFSVSHSTLHNFKLHFRPLGDPSTQHRLLAVAVEVKVYRASIAY